MPKGAEGKVWSFFISKLALASLVFAVFYLIGDSLHIIPQSLKDFISFLAGNLNLFAFLACFFVGAYVFLRIIQTRNRSNRGPSQ